MPRRVYLDYGATTPVDPAVRAAMLPTLGEAFGNPSSLHQEGREAAQLIEWARGQVAQGIRANPEEVCFTSGATEANNLALSGVLRKRDPRHGHLVTSAIEHHAVLHTAQALEGDGYGVTYLPVGSNGLVDPEDVRKAIRPETALISVMMVNNEVGTMQQIAEIGRIARQHGILMHTDAVQGVGLLDVAVDDLAVDLLSLSAHKIYGPKGVGALYVRKGTQLTQIIFGGSQESGLRAGTENVPGIVGLGAAVELTNEHKVEERERLSELRQRLITGLQEAIPTMIVNGSSTRFAPHIASVSFPGADGEMMLFRLNMQGVAVSMGSACTAEDVEPSHVLMAMRLPVSQIEGTLRLSTGYPTTSDDIDYVCEVLPVVVAQCR